MVLYNESIIEEVKSSNDIVDVISQYITLKRMGRNYFGLCPFHKEKSPSFSVSPDKQIFNCFGCKVGGNVIHFISKIENVDFKESMNILADRAGITLPDKDNQYDNKAQLLKEKVYAINKIVSEFYHQSLYKEDAKIAQEYVKKRKFSNNMLKSFTIGFAKGSNNLYEMLINKGYTEEEILESSLVKKTERGQFIDSFRERLMFPIQDVRDRVIGFGGRVLDDSLPKYINSPENIVYSKGRNLYGLNVAKKGNTDTLIIVEGYMDAISLYQRGITNVVASLGTALTEAQGRLLRKYAKKIVIAYDADGAGQTATLRGLEILKNMGSDVRVLELEEAKDPDEYVIKFGYGKFNLLIEKAISLVEFKIKMIKKELDLDNTNDKIKFLNEIAKILSEIKNTMELEIYIDKISKEYKISKEAIFAETNKLRFGNNISQKTLEKPIKVKINTNSTTNNPRENLIIQLLLDENINQNVYERIKTEVSPEDFNNPIAANVLYKLYENIEKGKTNLVNIIDQLEEEEAINYLSGVMAHEIEVENWEKGVSDILITISRDKLLQRKNEILENLTSNITKEENASLEQELSEVICKLAKK